MTPKKITLHCSASPDGVIYPAAKIRQFHMEERGWSDIGYHFVIQPSGLIEPGRPLTTQGAHVLNHNEDNVGICLVGLSHFTWDQFLALKHTIDMLIQTFKIPSWEIYCHAEFDTAQSQGKTCPNMSIHNLLYWYLTSDRSAIEPYLFGPSLQ